MAITSENFGISPKGEPITIYTITNKNNMKARVMDFGAILVNLFVADKNGNFKDVVLGYDDAKGYYENPCYLGSTIGRNSNRIKGACFELNGVLYKVDDNENGNNLHAGFDGYHKRMWEAKADEKNNSVSFHLVSPDLDQGFPGRFDISVTYTLSDDNEIIIHYEGVADKDTVANMTNHSYFNLSGHNAGSILDNELWINASAYTPVAEGSIPTGEIAPVKDTPMDFKIKKLIGDEIDADFEQLKITGGYDHNYVIDKEDEGLTLAAELNDKKSGIKMQVYTDCVGIQFYAGNFLNTAMEVCKEGTVYKKREGLALETQYFPNTVNEKNFPGCILKAGEKYDTTTSYKFFTE